MVPDLNGNLPSVSHLMTINERQHILFSNEQMSEGSSDENQLERVLDKEVLTTSLDDKLSVKREKDVEMSAMKIVIPLPATGSDALVSGSRVSDGSQMSNGCPSNSSQSSNDCPSNSSQPPNPMTSRHTIKIKVPNPERIGSSVVTSELEQSSSSISLKSELESEHPSPRQSVLTNPTLSPVVSSPIPASELTLFPTEPSLSPESKKVCVMPVEENPYEESESELSVHNKGETKAETKTYMGMTQKTWDEVP